MKDATIVCILGMHRSGTSALARVLNLLGVSLGPSERMMPAAPENPRGFWEHVGIVHLNEALLTRHGGTALDPPALDAACLCGPDVEDLQQRAKALVERDFADANLWGWKDPRTCLTLPFWQQFLPPMRYVLALREPLAVARSLQRRDGLTPEKALHLWLTHLRSALTHTASQPRWLIGYEDLLTNWRAETPRLAHFIGQPTPGPRMEAAIGEFLDADLQHHAASGKSIAASDRPGITGEAIQLAQSAYEELRHNGREQFGYACEMLDHALQLLGLEVHRQTVQQWNERRQQWTAAVQALRTNLMDLVPPGARFILADEQQTDVECPGRETLPFLERDGVYWGLPDGDVTAVRELERLRQSGASLIAFAWPAFWWLDHYTGLREHLRSHYRCAQADDCLIAFNLR